MLFGYNLFVRHLEWEHGGCDSRRSNVNKPQPRGFQHELGTGGYLEFAHNISTMGLHGGFL